MTLAPASRVNYFDRQFIRLAELRDEQAYHLALRRRHNLSHHSWGIVVGLEIVLDEGGRAVLQPGLAVDGYGRELLLLEHHTIGRDLFDRYGTMRLDLWLEYLLELADDRLAPVECGGDDPRRRYRAVERALVVPTRGGARPDPRHPPGVPSDALQEPLLATPDDPRSRWPVYLGRVTMEIPASGVPRFDVDVADRVYVGLNAALIDHPGNPSRLELGRRPPDEDTRTFGDVDQKISYEAGPERDFAVFVPGTEKPLQPAIAVYPEGTQIRGTTTVHGNLVLDGASLRFPEGVDVTADKTAATGGDPAVYRTQGPDGDELRIDLGEVKDADRKLVIGVTKDGKFIPALEISFPSATSPGSPKPVVTVHGDVHIEGSIKSPDVKTRMVTDEVAAILLGMVQAGVAAGS